MKKERNLKTRYAGRKWKLMEHHVSHLDPISMTVPDESMSLQEILRKHTSGMNTVETNYREGQYNDEDDFDAPDLEKLRDMDIHDRENYILLLQQKRKDAEEKIVAAKLKQMSDQDKKDAKADSSPDDSGPAKTPEAKPRKEGGTTDATKAKPKE